jgi:ABC-type sulfate transport system substrate-binding protein
MLIRATHITLVLLAAALAAGPARAAKLELLNVSYDPTRELSSPRTSTVRSTRPCVSGTRPNSPTSSSSR